MYELRRTLFWETEGTIHAGHSPSSRSACWWTKGELLWVGLDERIAGAKGRVLPIMLGRLIVKNYVEKGLVDVDAAVVIDKAELAKAIHEEADAGSSRSNHVGKRLLRDLWDFHQRRARPPEFRHQQENPCQTLFAGIE